MIKALGSMKARLQSVEFKLHDVEVLRAGAGDCGVATLGRLFSLSQSSAIGRSVCRIIQILDVSKLRLAQELLTLMREVVVEDRVVLEEKGGCG